MDRDLVTRLAKAKGRTRSKGARRMVDYLFIHGRASTAELARETGVGNLSDTANKIRPALLAVGLKLVAERPERPIRNRYGENSEQHIWRIERAP